MSELSIPYYKRTDTDLVEWMTQFLGIVQPQAATWGLTTPFVTSLSETAGVFSARVATWHAPATRTPLACAAKDEARESLLSELKRAILLINGTETVTELMKREIDIPIAKPKQRRTVVNVAPILSILSRDATNITLGIKAPGTLRAAKTKTSECVFIYYFVGETPSTTESDWVFAGAHKTAVAQVPLPSSLAVGTKVWFTAQYYNSAGTGPSSPALSTVIAGGGGAFGEASNPSMKLAA